MVVAVAMLGDGSSELVVGLVLLVVVAVSW